MAIVRRRPPNWSLLAVVAAPLVALSLVLASCGGGGGAASPKPGAAFTGPVEIGKDKASSAVIRFAVSADGESITSVGIVLTQVKCEAMSSGLLSQEVRGPFPLKEGTIDISSSSIGDVSGKFTSTTEASGTVNLVLKITVLGSTVSCDLGTGNWSAKAS